jgi:hypothetical protein
VDFIERIFGVAPDQGNGLIEAVIAIVVVSAAALIYHRCKRGGRTDQDSSDQLNQTSIRCATHSAGHRLSDVVDPSRAVFGKR